MWKFDFSLSLSRAFEMLKIDFLQQPGSVEMLTLDHLEFLWSEIPQILMFSLLKGQSNFVLNMAIRI